MTDDQLPVAFSLTTKAMSVAELAERLGCSTSWIYKQVESGQIPHFRLGAAIRFNSVDIEAWLQSLKRSK